MMSQFFSLVGGLDGCCSEPLQKSQTWNQGKMGKICDFCVLFSMFPSSAEVFILLVINILNTGIGFIARDLTNALVAKARMVWHGYGMVCLICDSDLPL